MNGERLKRLARKAVDPTELLELHADERLLDDLAEGIAENRRLGRLLAAHVAELEQALVPLLAASPQPPQTPEAP